ncbi:MAG: hypothetical protein WD492_04545 [Alkalispirochaeta sp.]
MKVIRLMRIVAATAAVLLLAGCILQPEDGGSLSFTVSAPQGDVSSNSVAIDGRDDLTGTDDVDYARVWLYSNGAEYRLAPTSAGAPSSRNYVEADLSSGGATVKIDGIPAGDGYSAVIIMGTKEDGVFVPVAYARTGRFAINAGREARPTADKVALVGDEDSLLSAAEFNLLGKNLNSVVANSDGVFTSDANAVYQGPNYTGSGSGEFGTINRLSTGTLEGDSVIFVNSSEGIFKAKAGELPEEITPSDDTDVDVRDVTFSGTFAVEDAIGEDIAEDVVFYQRLGGLGGVAAQTINSESDWQDFGAADLEDLIDPDRSPVRAQASGTGKGFFATAALDNFLLTEALFDNESDIEAADLISGSADGVQFFNVPYPGTTRPMRLNHMTIVEADETEYLVVGTPRGAFTFPAGNIGHSNAARFNSTTNLVNSSHSTFRSLVRDEAVFALATDSGGKILAVATAETVVVLDVTDGIPTSRDDALFILPRRGVALGEVTGLALETDGSQVTLHISGTQGLTTVIDN